MCLKHRGAEGAHRALNIFICFNAGFSKRKSSGNVRAANGAYTIPGLLNWFQRLSAVSVATSLHFKTVSCKLKFLVVVELWLEMLLFLAVAFKYFHNCSSNLFSSPLPLRRATRQGVFEVVDDGASSVGTHAKGRLQVTWWQQHVAGHTSATDATPSAAATATTTG